MVTTGILPLQGKIPTVEPGIEPGTSWLVVRSSDHQTTRLVGTNKCICKGRRNYPALPADRGLILVTRPLADSIYAVKGKQ